VDLARIRRDFDEIARLVDDDGSGQRGFDAYLVACVPPNAARLLDVGCGLGGLTRRLAAGGRSVIGVDLSPEMIERARRATPSTCSVEFVCGEFLGLAFGSVGFDCVISAATLHHLPSEAAIRRMVDLLRPGGRLIVHDLRTTSGLLDEARAMVALGLRVALRLLRTGRARPPRPVREAWERHGAGEAYLTLDEAQEIARRLLPGSPRVHAHWGWRYTILWDKPTAAPDP
jgi:2-polyprenyl-3-methyl-5-hydroxy-6-metoxy-1,4-benzoquinol methylase